MAYTIIRSDGNVLTTVQDGTVNTTACSIGLPGRNQASYGQLIDTNLVRMLENFANDAVPPNPIKGQLWYNTNTNQLCVCPADGTTVASSWPVLTTSTSMGDTTLGNLNVTGNIIGNNLSINNAISGNSITVFNATVSNVATCGNANITSANITTLTTQTITTGAQTTAGTLTGTWTIQGNSAANGLILGNGNISFSSATFGIRCDNYMNADGSPFTPSGTYTDEDVWNYLTGNASGFTVGAQFNGNIAPTKVTTSMIAGGGTIANIWTLDTGARIQATYADLAERYEADAIYEPGTVVELGGEKEITAVADDLSESVLGVISNTAAYLMNSTVGNDETHPAVAIAGRLKVKVTGKVNKGDRLVSAGSGKARAGTRSEINAFNTIGRAIESKDTEGDGLIEAVVIIN